ncbi:glycoside hydrolase, partial [Cladochytrium replicatum]
RRRGSVDEKVSAPRRFFIDVEETKRIILAQEDTDGDFQITVQDSGPKSFQLGSANSGGFRKYDIRGTYMLSNLLQELALASDYGRKYIVLDEERLRENPVERMTRLIKFHFWDGLTRRIDAEGLELICNDPKGNPNDKVSRVYVPYHDKYAFDYYTEVAKTRPHLNIGVIRLPEIITPQYVKSLNRTPGILSLMLREQTDPNTKQKIIRGVPFVVPGGRFNEMYGWDSYFEALGLLVDGRVELARGMVDNFCYCIEHYGKILNANRSYYLTRSQPPFLTDMTLEVYRHLRTKPATWNPPNLSAWLSQSFRGSVKELLSIWLASPRLDAVVGLSKFHPEGIGMPPETESTHFNHILEPFAERMGIDLETYKEMYATDQIKEPELDAYFVHDRAVRESGHDTTYRFEKRCANLATIDLNALVFKYEVDIARVLIEHVANGTTSENPNAGAFYVRLPAGLFLQLSNRTRQLVNQYLWNPTEHLFYDYDCKEQEPSAYETVTTFYALWSGLATEEQARHMVPKALDLFEVKGGLVSGTEESRGRVGLDRPNRQWDFPYGWAPHQILGWSGMVRYGFVDDARRVAYRWLYMISKSFVDFNGVVPEKFDVVNMTHKVNVEYGNVGADFKFVVREGFGWMNASFEVGVSYLTRNLRRALGALTPPDRLFDSAG